MKALDNLHTNPTNYFFQQSQNAGNEHLEEIDKLVSTLIDLQKCMLCREPYNFTNRIPRILIHCGHTFCTSCLLQFYRNFRIRCPVCLKLIKHIEFIEKLPMNHTIMNALANQENQTLEQQGKGNEGLFVLFNFARQDKYGRDLVYNIHAEQLTAVGITRTGPFNKLSASGYDKAVYGLINLTKRIRAVSTSVSGLGECQYCRTYQRSIPYPHSDSAASGGTILEIESVLNGLL